jgi:ParB-like chromosome segregation protein Spo0J
MTGIQPIPLSKLDVGRLNVRKTLAGDDLGDLIASIEAHGPLQSLVVQPGKRGR